MSKGASSEKGRSHPGDCDCEECFWSRGCRTAEECEGVDVGFVMEELWDKIRPMVSDAVRDLPADEAAGAVNYLIEELRIYREGLG